MYPHFSGTPAPPSIPRITDTHADSISLAWSRPVEDGGADVIGYILEMQEAGAEEWTKAHEKTLRNPEYTVTGLSANKKYCFRVAGINVNGTVTVSVNIERGLRVTAKLSY